MFPCLGFGYGYWWIFPLIMIAMIVFCVFMMRGHAGAMICGPVFGRSGVHGENASDRIPDIPNIKNAQGEIGKREDEEK